MRSPVEDVGTTPRKPLTASQKRKLYEDQGGICPLCARRMAIGEPLIDEHLRALGLGGGNKAENRAIVHARCANVKTAGPGGDLSRIAKAKAQKVAALGLRNSARPMPFGRGSKLKQKINGDIVDRETGRLIRAGRGGARRIQEDIR